MRDFKQLPKMVRIFVRASDSKEEIASYAYNTCEKYLLSAVSLAVRNKHALLVAFPEVGFRDEWKLALESVIGELELEFTAEEQELILKVAKGDL